MPAVTKTVIKSYWSTQRFRIGTAVRSPSTSLPAPAAAAMSSISFAGSAWLQSAGTVWLKRVEALRIPPEIPVLAARNAPRTKRVSESR